MKIEFILLTFVYSLILASFLNVVSIRIPKGESIVFPPSHCVHCHQRLLVYDLIPIVSYLILKGRCIFCSYRITPLYTIGEFVIATTITFTVCKIGYSGELWVALPFICLLSIVFISDVLYMIIPNKINYAGFIYFLTVRLCYHPLPLMDYILGILAGGGVLLLLSILSRGGMGGGDIKLMTVVGLTLGWKLTLLSLLLASFLGSVLGIMMLVARVFKRKQLIPFGPFLGIGSFISYFWGMDFIRIYIDMVKLSI